MLSFPSLPFTQTLNGQFFQGMGCLWMLLGGSDAENIGYVSFAFPSPPPSPVLFPFPLPLILIRNKMPIISHFDLGHILICRHGGEISVPELPGVRVR